MAIKGPYIEGSKAYISMTIAPDQVHALDRLVTERRTTRSQLLREAVDVFLRLNPPRLPLRPFETADEPEVERVA
jgi:hypothetical protein